METTKNDPTKSTVDPNEVAHFGKMAETWWDPKGPFKPLHKLNPTRLSYIRRSLANHFDLELDTDADIVDTSADFLKGLSGLDIGCGGGLLTEPLAKWGGNMLGADATEKNIHIARHHANEEGVDVEYRHITAEQLVDENAQFDFIINMEVLEHVADVSLFLDATYKLLKPGGIMLFSTLNRTIKSYMTAIVGAEYVMRWLPKGTHHWNKFIKPSELHRALSQQQFFVQDMEGMIYNPVNDQWRLGRDLSINYLGSALKAK